MGVIWGVLGVGALFVEANRGVDALVGGVVWGVPVVDGLVACSLGGVPGVESVGAVVVWEEVVRDWLVCGVCVVRISRSLCIGLGLCLCMLCVPSVLCCGCSVWMFGILFYVAIGCTRRIAIFYRAPGFARRPH